MEHESFMQSLDEMFSDDSVSSVGSSSSEMAGPDLAKMTGEDGKPLPAGTIAKLVSIYRINSLVAGYGICME